MAASIVAGAAFGIFAIGNADAQTPSPISLSWNAPEGCSDGAAILKHVSDLRGGTASAEQMSAIANVTLDQASGIWNLQITTNFADGTHGERQIQAESCKAAADATASILALALTNRAQEVAAAAGSTASGDRVASTAAPKTPADAGAPATHALPDAGPRAGADAVVEQPVDRASPTPRAPVQIYVAGFVGGTVGDLPSFGFGGGGAVGISYRMFRVEGLVDDYAFGRAHIAPTGSANFQVFSVGARACASLVDAFSLGPCLDFQLASMAGESFDVTSPSSGSALVPEVFVGALGAIPLDKNRHFALRALLEVGTPFSRPQFVLDGVGFVHQPAPIIGRGTIGAEVRF